MARLTSNIESLTHREVSGSKPRETERERDRDRPPRSLDDDSERSPNVPSTIIRSPRSRSNRGSGKSDRSNPCHGVAWTVTRFPGWSAPWTLSQSPGQWRNSFLQSDRSSRRDRCLVKKKKKKKKKRRKEILKRKALVSNLTDWLRPNKVNYREQHIGSSRAGCTTLSFSPCCFVLLLLGNDGSQF